MLDNIARTTDNAQPGEDWRAMVLAARALHEPSALAAGEYDDGTCAYCSDDPEMVLLSRFRGHLNGAKTKTWMHTHPDRYPTCTTCAGYAAYDASYADWPCATAVALGVPR